MQMQVIKVVIIAIGEFNNFMISLLPFTTRESLFYHIKIPRFHKLLGSTCNLRICSHLVVTLCVSLCLEMRVVYARFTHVCICI